MQLRPADIDLVFSGNIGPLALPDSGCALHVSAAKASADTITKTLALE